MVTSVRVKPLKKQPVKRAWDAPHADVSATRKLERAALHLEECVLDVLEASKGHAFHDVDFLYWDRQLKNIAAPVSLALSEYKGPRRFHYHYRHAPDDYDTLIPVYSPPLPTLARVCQEALIRCDEMLGVRDPVILKLRARLECCLRGFLQKYNATARKTQ